MPEIEENVKNLVDEIIDIELGNLRLKYKLKKKKTKGKKKKSKKKKPKKVPGARLCKNRDPRDMLAEVYTYIYGISNINYSTFDHHIIK